MEPLLATIQNSIDIGGVKIGDEEHKVAAYADDILFYISNPRITLPNLMKLLKHYGEISNLKMNLSKSEILKINLGKKEEQALQREFPFTWRKTEQKYLEIKLMSSLKKANYIPLLNEMKMEIKKITARSLSWVGRINIGKLIILLKILYKYQMLTIFLPPTYFKILKAMILRYIGKKKKP